MMDGLHIDLSTQPAMRRHTSHTATCVEVGSNPASPLKTSCGRFTQAMKRMSGLVIVTTRCRHRKSFTILASDYHKVDLSMQHWLRKCSMEVSCYPRCISNFSNILVISSRWKKYIYIKSITF